MKHRMFVAIDWLDGRTGHLFYRWGFCEWILNHASGTRIPESENGG